MNGEYYPVAQQECEGLTRLSLTERLERDRKHLSDRVAKIDKILAGLKANPETQELLDAISELGGF